MTKGIITIATSDYLESAKLLAKSARKFSNLPTTLITTEPIEAEEFDNVITVPGDLYNAFSVGLLSTPYTKTAFIYADSLVLSDITPYFDLLNKVDLVTPVAFDFKGIPVPSYLFNDRKIISKNSLPDVWTNFFLYNVQGITEVTDLLPNINHLWNDILSASCSEYSIDAELKHKINVAFSIAVQMSGIPYYNGNTRFTNLSKQTNNVMLPHLASKEWHQLLSFWATDDDFIKIENYNQTGVVHYTAGWLDDHKRNSITAICN